MRQQIFALFLFTLGGVTVGKAQDAHSRIDSLRAQLQLATVDTQRVYLLHQLSESYLNSDPQATLRYAKRALALSDSLSYPPGQANAFLDIGIAYSRLSRYDRAINFLQKARQIAREANYDEGVFRAFNAIGLSYAQTEEYTLAVQRLRNALSVAQRTNNKENEGTAYNNLGMVYFLQDNYVRSLENYLAAIQIFEAQNDLTKMASAYLNLGSMAAARTDYDEATTYYHKALRLFETMENDQAVVKAHYGIGRVSMMLEDYTTAEQSYTLALRGANEYEDQAMRADILNDFGNLAYRRDDFTDALDYYQQSLTIQRDISSQRGIATSLVDIGELYNARGQYQTAIDFASDGLDLAQAEGALAVAQDAAYALHDAYLALGRNKQALTYFKTYTQYKDSLMSLQSAKEIQQLMFERTLEQQETENDLLKAKTEWQAEQVALQKKVRNFLILGCALLGGLAFLLLWGINKIKRANKMLNERNQKIASTAENLIHANTEISHQRDALEEANRSKNKLFSVISHDLRSPLNSLQGLFALLQDGHLSAEELRSLLPELTQQLGHTHSLLDNLLIWAKSQMQGIRSHPDGLDLIPLIHETVQLVASQAEHKRIRTEIDTPLELEGYADLDMVKIVLRNLLTNAIKFTSEQGTVRVVGYRKLDLLHIEIKDTGVGISEQDQKLLFVDDTASTTGTKGEKGTGLGLLLSKDFVEKNGGTIWVESQMNLGSTFTFTVPANAETFVERTRPVAVHE